MNRLFRRLAWVAVAVLAGTVPTILMDQPALAAPPCFGAACDGKSPFDTTVVSGCGTFVPYFQSGSSDRAVLTIRYSSTCHAAYAEMVIPDPGGTAQLHALLPLYMPQNGGRALSAKTIGVSSTVQVSTLLDWDYSLKACYILNEPPPYTDPDPYTNKQSDTGSFCTLWT
ncbi:DUF2690 domain-containing protein [Actinoplanes sp. NPDC020271]|uniref:DUF2690 domain-containing protein n=1 Tax=Actinoplanes sp. NPDC020271 TaxID=3363896 RepID=UPI003789286C